MLTLPLFKLKAKQIWKSVFSTLVLHINPAYDFGGSMLYLDDDMKEMEQ